VIHWDAILKWGVALLLGGGSLIMIYRKLTSGSREKVKIAEEKKDEAEKLAERLRHGPVSDDELLERVRKRVR